MAIYDPTAPKRAFNMFLNEDLVSRIRAKSTDKLSAKVESLLAADLVAHEEQVRTEADNLRRAAQGWNAFIEKHGSFADEFSTL